jgi:hypothetical protein
MITTDQGMETTHAAIGDLLGALASIQKREKQMHPDRYRMQVEPVVYDILRLRNQIDEYLSIPELAALFADDWAAMEAETAAERVAESARAATG